MAESKWRLPKSSQGDATWAVDLVCETSVQMGG